MQSLGLLWLVFDTGIGLTPLMGHLGYLSSHWSVSALNCHFFITKSSVPPLASEPQFFLSLLLPLCLLVDNTYIACIGPSISFILSNFYLLNLQHYKVCISLVKNTMGIDQSIIDWSIPIVSYSNLFKLFCHEFSVSLKI